MLESVEIPHLRKIDTSFHGAMTRMTPRGVRLIYLLKPGISVSLRETSAREGSAIDIMYRARSRNPRTSPSAWDTGLETEV
jgi:hypothetical protein